MQRSKQLTGPVATDPCSTTVRSPIVSKFGPSMFEVQSIDVRNSFHSFSISKISNSKDPSSRISTVRFPISGFQRETLARVSTSGFDSGFQPEVFILLQFLTIVTNCYNCYILLQLLQFVTTSRLLTCDHDLNSESGLGFLAKDREETFRD